MSNTQTRNASATEASVPQGSSTDVGITKDEYKRFGRQMLVPELSLDGQIKLKKASILVVGAGGLGSPALIYLVTAGIGHVGIVDGDTVSLNNLHRQVLHGEDSIGVKKVDSAEETLRRLYSSTRITKFSEFITPENVMSIMKNFDVVVDASDNVSTRYLLSDAAILLHKPLVSACVLKGQGQLSVYNMKGAACYRCVFPEPSPSGTVQGCNNGGILNAVPGVFGALQALEVIKIVSTGKSSYAGKMLYLDLLTGEMNVLKLRGKRAECEVCGLLPTIQSMQGYTERFGFQICNKPPCLEILSPDCRITCKEYQEISKKPHLLIDVRSSVEYAICHLPQAINIPLLNIEKEIKTIIKERDQVCINAGNIDKSSLPVYFICKLGNQSQMAVQKIQKLSEKYKSGNVPSHCKDIIGGITAWAEEVDPSFPLY